MRAVWHSYWGKWWIFPLPFHSQLNICLPRMQGLYQGIAGTTATAAAKSLQSCPTLCDPIDGSPPGSPIPGILQARTLEWVAISFSSAWKWKVKGKSLSPVWLFTTPWTAAHQTPPSMGFSRQEYWSGVPSPSPLVPQEAVNHTLLTTTVQNGNLSFLDCQDQGLCFTCCWSLFPFVVHSPLFKQIKAMNSIKYISFLRISAWTCL